LGGRSGRGDSGVGFNHCAGGRGHFHIIVVCVDSLSAERTACYRANRRAYGATHSRSDQAAADCTCCATCYIVLRSITCAIYVYFRH